MTRSPSIRQASANAWRQASQDHTDDLGAVVDREEDSGRYSGVTGQRSGCSSSESTVRSRPLNHAGALLRRALDRSIREVVETVGFVRTIEDSREADFRFSNPLRGSLEVFDLAHPAGQWVPSGENLGHHLQVVDSKRLKSPTHSIRSNRCDFVWLLGRVRCTAVFRLTKKHASRIGMDMREYDVAACRTIRQLDAEVRRAGSNRI